MIYQANNMHDQTYSVDENQYTGLKKRLLIRNTLFMGAVFVVASILEYPNLKGTNFNFGIFLLFIIPLMFLPAYLGTNRLVNSYKTLAIVLCESAVESKAENMPYKKISFSDLIIKQKSNGAINLYDKNISAFMRKMYGKGMIIIPPEIFDKQSLLHELMMRAGAASF